MSDVVKFQPKEVGSAFRFDPDEILEEAKGNEFVKIAVLAERPDGSIYVSGNSNAGETLMLMEMAKRRIVFGED